MKYYLKLIAISSIFVLGTSQAQQTNTKKKVMYKGKSYLSDGTGQGTISVSRFKSMLHNGLIAKDTAQVQHPVHSFIFMYAERGVFEDSTGKLRIMSDNFSLQCDSGKLPEMWVKGISTKAKAGDTAYYSNVLSSYDDSGKKFFYAEPLKLILTED